MYVIFPAEEVVYYGYQLISATGQRSDPSISLDNHEISSLSRDSSLEQGPLQQSPCGSVRNSSNSNKCNKKPTSSNIRKHSRSETSRKQGLKHKVSKSEPNSPLFSHNNSLKTASSDNKRTPNLSLRSNRDLTSQKSNLNISFDLSDKYNYNPSEKSPNLTTPSPSLIIDPDPRLQLSNLQKERVPEKLPKRRIFFSSKKSITIDSAKMASSTEATLRELTHPSFNEHMKAHNSVTFKLVKTVSDFTQQLSQIYEHHAEELQLLVENFRKRNGELRKERPACPSSLFHTWETLLQEVEIDSQNHSDIASILGRQVSRPLLERSFHRKIQSRKVFTHRESYETIISKTEEKLAKCRQDYKNAYFAYLSAPTTSSLSAYFDTHNAYVQQLHATNGMLNEYSKDTLPQLLQELEEIYADLCTSVADAVLQGAEVVSQRAIDQSRRYEVLSSQCRAVSGPTDLAHFARALPQPPHNRPIMKRLFNPPQPPVVDPNAEPGADGERPFEQLNEKNIPPPLKNELVIDRLSSVQVKPSYDALRKESTDLELQIKQIKDALDTLIRIQQRSLESNLFNKVNEIQEDISIKRFDLSVAQIHLSAINSQKELFANKMDLGDTGRERKMSSSSTGSMKSKWLKAFKSLKTPPSSASTSPKENEKKNGSASSTRSGMVESDAHTFQEYTYKKITPCDICSQVLRGHTHQGLRCRVCKINVHIDCQDKVGKCQVKSRLLRRQKSTSEIDARVPETANEEEKSSEVDLIYQVLKQATNLSNTKHSARSAQNNGGAIPTISERSQPNQDTGESFGITTSEHIDSGSDWVQGSVAGPVHNIRRGREVDRGRTSNHAESTSGSSVGGYSNLTVCNPVPHSSCSAPHSPRRQKLNLRMKSLSLDSPESTEHAQKRRHGGIQSGVSVTISGGIANDQNSSTQLSSSRIHSPTSPIHNRRLLNARNMRMSSVELVDDNEKSLSSASTSPCPSPVGAKKPHRLLPTNLYVILYNYKSRHSDELDLKAGYKVTVIDTSDSDWWKGKCLGKIGYFPSKYCTKLMAGEKPLQVIKNLRITGSDKNEGLLLLRDQIVIQVGEEVEGMVMIRNGNNQTGYCPLKFLQEV